MKGSTEYHDRKE